MVLMVGTVLLFGLVLPDAAKCQQFECGTVAEVDTLGYFASESEPPYPSPDLPSQVVLRVYVHVVEGNPSSDRFSDEEIDATMEVLRQDLAPFGIIVEEVSRDGVPAVYTAYNYPALPHDINLFTTGFAGAHTVMRAYEDGVIASSWPINGLHLFFASKVYPRGCGEHDEYHAHGVATGIPGASAIVYGSDSIGTHVLSHEVGHCLGLYHTHANDMVADTPPDPNLRQESCCEAEGGTSLVNQDCEYSYTSEQNECSPVDLSTFTPDPANIMAYSTVDCQEYFTAGQGARMRNMLQEQPVLQTRWRSPDLANRSADTDFNYSPTPYSAIALDYNDDGRMDLLLSSVDGAAGLIENTPNAEHSDVPLFVNSVEDEFGQLNIPQDTRGIAVADFDNDGDLDLLFTSISNPQIFEHDTSAQNRFTDISSSVMYGGTFTSNADSSWAAAWGDYDRDGHIDLYIGRAGGTTTASGGLRDVLLRNQGDGTFAQVTSLVGLSAAPHLTTTGVAWVDANEDGELDLVVAGAGSSEELIVLKQSISVTPEYEYEHTFAVNDSLVLGGITSLEHIRGVSVRDIDNDGHLDLVLASSGSGSDGSRILWGSGASGFSQQTLLGDGIAASGVALADLGLNGATDVLLTPAGSAETPAVLVNEDDASLRSFLERGQFLGLATSTATNFQAVALADFAGSGGTPDGDLDLYLGRAASTDAFFYQNARGGTDTPSNKWLKVKVVSDDLPNNRGGIGSVVKVEATLPGSVPLVQTQIVDGGSGVGTQAAHELVFGLADAVGDVEVEVTWPDGWVQETIVSNSSLPTTVTMQENRTTVGLVAAAVEAYVIMDPLGDASWTFEWETSYLSDPSKDAVSVWGGKGACTISPPVELTPGESDVTHNVFALEGGGYLHRLAWDGRTCAIGCSYKFRVESAVSATADPDTSAHETLSISSCISN